MANAWGDAWGGDSGAWLTAWGSGSTPPPSGGEDIRFRGALNRRRMGGLFRIIILLSLIGL